MTDAEFLDNERRYYAHMRRFICAHKDQPQGGLLIEMERHERWEKLMGSAAAVLAAPEIAEIETAPG